MANYPLTRTYSEQMVQLTTTTPASANTFNPIINQLLNNDANASDRLANVESILGTNSSGDVDAGTF